MTPVAEALARWAADLVPGPQDLTLADRALLDTVAVALAASVSCAALLCGGEARADGAGAWVAGASMKPAEQRIAVSVGPSRTTVWTSLRFESNPGPVGIVIPVSDGAMLDESTDAWFEALETATAPRILPPVGQPPGCPGQGGTPAPFELVGDTGHLATLPPSDPGALQRFQRGATVQSAKKP